MVRDGAIVTLYAQWQKDDSGEVTPDPPVPDGGGSSGGRSSGGGSDAPDVTDPNDNSVADWLETVNHIPYMPGYPDETFKPTNNITRAEVATVFYRLLLNKDVEKGSFSDVAEDSWYYDAVSTLAGIDVLKGYADGTFRPNAPITRAEFSAIVTRLPIKLIMNLRQSSPMWFRVSGSMTLFILQITTVGSAATLTELSDLSKASIVPR